MFYLPIITDSPLFVGAARRLRNLKIFIPVTIAVIAYAVVIANIIAIQGSPKAPSPGGEAPQTTLPPGGQGGNPSSPAPNPTEDTPTAQPSSAPPSGPTTRPPPGATTTRPPSTPPSSTTPGSTTKPGSTSTPAPGTTTKPGSTSTPAPGTTTRPPTTPKPPAGPPTTQPATHPSGTFPANETSPVPPAELGGKRGFCFRNSCKQPVWVGQIGGSTGVPCAGGCPKGTICNPEVGDCYFSLPFPENKMKLESNGLWCLAFDYDPVTTTIHMPDGDIKLVVQWSGAIYGSTGCDGGMNCETGICKNCPSYRGPVGPVSQAELTLSGIWKDYFDTTLIHGANLPLVIKPMTHRGSFYPDQWAPPAYHCTSPGGVTRSGDHWPATWVFNTSLPTKRQHMDIVPLVAGGSNAKCTSLYGCPEGEMCGGKMDLTDDNKPRPDLFMNVCGRPVGFWSRSEMCGWTDAKDDFADCKLKPYSHSGTMQQLYKCATPHHESCFQPIADTMCCGCTVWQDFIPTHGEPCKIHNPVWEETVMPHLEQIKRGCPTCYTFPYDDSTALYTCWDDDLWNSASYEFEWCPGGTELQFTQ